MRRATVYGPRRDSHTARLLRAFYSAIIPGVGQLVAGARRRGLILLGIFVAVSLVGIVMLSRGMDGILAFVVQPKVLLTLLVVNVVVMLVRMFAVLDAWMTKKSGSLKPPRASRREAMLTGVGLVVILFLCITPHAVAGYYTAVSHNLLTSVFRGGDSGSSGTTLASTNTPGSEGSTGQGPTTSLQMGSDERLTILLIGTDAGNGRTGARADSINIATVNLRTGSVAIFGIPRNMAGTPLGKKTAAALKKTTFPDIINALYDVGLRHPEIAPNGDSGAEAVRETASLMLGIPIDYYAVVDLLGLVDMVNAFGGVDVNVKSRLRVYHPPGLTKGDPARTYYLEPGIYHFNGLQALDYARSRADADDYARMRRQRCVLLALLYQNGLGSLTLKFPKIAAALEKNVRTNIPADALPQLINLRGQIKTGEMISLGLGPPDYVSGQNAKRYNLPNIPAMKAAVKAIITNPAKWVADHTTSTGQTSAGTASDCYAVKK
jgi:polyisoprenyl-teichoic acid--peptidoglycan teichoic acid transferase